MEFKVEPGDVVVCDKYEYGLILDETKMLVCVGSNVYSHHPLTPKIVPLESDVFPIKPSEIPRLLWSYRIIFSTARLLMNKPSLIPESDPESLP